MKGMNHSTKNGQIQTQMFVYLLAIIIIGLLLMFGVRSILDLLGKEKDIGLLKFKTEIESAAKRIAPNYGKWEKISFDIPREIETVCFVQHQPYMNDIFYKEQEGLCDPNNEDYHFLMCNSWKDVQTANVFTEPFDALEGGSIYLSEVEVRNPGKHYLCVEIVDGKLNVKIVGRGNRILIESWEE